MRRAIKYNSVLLLFFCGLGVTAGEITGLVADPDGNPVARMLVRLESNDRTAWTFSDGEGNFAFPGLEAGDYLCYLQPSQAFHTTEPPCGFYHVSLGDGGLVNLPFEVAHTTGVSVEFGTPSGNNGSGIIPVSGNDFTVSIYGAGLVGANPAKRRMVITGYWMVPGQGAINVFPGNANAAGSYLNTGTGVTVTIASDGLVTIEISNYSSPFLGFDGELAQIVFSLDAPPFGLQLPRHLVFCVESVTLWTDQEPAPGVGRSLIANLQEVRSND